MYRFIDNEVKVELGNGVGGPCFEIPFVGVQERNRNINGLFPRNTPSMPLLPTTNWSLEKWPRSKSGL